MDRRRFLRKAGIGSIALASVPSLQHALGTPASVSGPADHVRWDIQSFDSSTSPPTLHPGGVAFASADPDRRIRLTGAGTFVAPASGGTSGTVTGGGSWETFGPGDVSTGSGTYQVTGLVSWQFANLQTGTLNDLIGDTNERANGNAVLRIGTR